MTRLIISVAATTARSFASAIIGACVGIVVAWVLFTAVLTPECGLLDWVVAGILVMVVVACLVAGLASARLRGAVWASIALSLVIVAPVGYLMLGSALYLCD